MNNSKIRTSFQLSVQKPEPNHKWDAESNKPIKTQSKHSPDSHVAETKCSKHVQVSHNCVWFYICLIKQKSSTCFLANHVA